jgi:hypothetical protein
MKKITFTLLFLVISLISKGQTTLIPDPVFEQELINQGIDTNGFTGNILNSDAQAIIMLSVDNANINDITGINAFTNLTSLSCFGNNLTAVNLAITNLQTLHIDNNTLSTLDLSNLPALSVLNARNNQIATLIPIPFSNTYTEVRLGNNSLTGNIDFSGFSNLSLIELSNNNISTLDVTGLINLDFLAVDNCGLAVLDLTTNINLTNLTALNNNLTCLDLTQNPLLIGIEVNNNDPQLIIAVTNVAAANAGSGIYQFWFKDASATYASSCATAAIDDVNFASNFRVYPNPASDVLFIQSELNSQFIIFDVTGKPILNGRIQNGSNTVNINTLQSGLYLMKIVSEQNKSTTNKIIIK